MRSLRAPAVSLLALTLTAGVALGQGVPPVPAPSPVILGPTSIRDGSPTQPIFLGINAGATFPIGTPLGDYGTVGIGSGALQSLTGTGVENTALGGWACQYLTTSSLNTCVGMHTLGFDQTSNGNSAFGNDSMRDSVTTGGYTTALGAGALGHGNPAQGVTAVGMSALNGNSATIVLTGTKTTGDVLTIGLSSSYPGIVGSPFSYNYTVQAGDTLATIATALANGIKGGLTSPSIVLNTQVNIDGQGAYIIGLYFPGSTTAGWSLAITPTKSGGATEIMTVTGGAQAARSTAVGAHALGGFAMATTTDNVAVGDSAGNSIKTASYSTLIGASAGQSLTTAGGLAGDTTRGGNTFVGASAGLAATTAYKNTFLGMLAGTNAISSTNLTLLGERAGQNITTANNMVIVGGEVGLTCATGGSVILVGAAGNADCPAAGSSFWLNIGNAVLESMTVPTVQSGFGTGASVTNGKSSAAFTVGVGTGGVVSTGNISLGNAAPNGWACSAVDQTNPAGSNTVATPNTTGSISLTNYSRTTGLATPWVASDVVVVACHGY
jgi:hypothetical protein